jgi:hypothetical protein
MWDGGGYTGIRYITYSFFHQALMFGLWWVLGYCVISPMAYLLPNWRWLIFAASAPSVLLGLLYLYILPESFHWLASNGDERRIRAFIERANYFARYNSRD